MISAEEYRSHDALGLAELVRSRQVSAVELLEAAIARSAQVNPKLNAIIIPMHELARARAKENLDGPFAGVPFLTKDLFQEYAGVQTAYGCKGLKAANYKPDAHAEITARWLRAGAVIFGRTNTPEFGAKGITEPEAWGPTRNPWNLDHVPGGSSAARQQRWPPASCRWPAPTMAVVRSASRLVTVACSASSRAAGARPGGRS